MFALIFEKFDLGRLLENQVFIELVRRGYDVERTMFYYRSRNDKEVDFVLRKGAHIECLVRMIWAFVTSWPKAVWIHTYFLERVSYKGDINHTRLLVMSTP